MQAERMELWKQTMELGVLVRHQSSLPTRFLDNANCGKYNASPMCPDRRSPWRASVPTFPKPYKQEVHRHPND
jgi:hypothetical protein